ncbi:hypothetical protein F511_17420 [Dorcoceras hygrometricum]|uniref:Uncharacterized protein n=1 Tax=Dorcoceras hygrometricum TaxID=472368 RepID=A0A2Z7C514_9LAMI|nr:hypothetical protein F511_17420 [Dorcoceras hygrometricum]
MSSYTSPASSKRSKTNPNEVSQQEESNATTLAGIKVLQLVVVLTQLVAPQEVVRVSQ